MKDMSLGARPASDLVGLGFQELKFAALVVFLAATTRAGTRRYDAAARETDERDIPG